jgi:hypothetical protein
MGTLGSYLRAARETRGLDLRDAAQQTRIGINYLKAIEDEDFSKLPGEVFVKGFLKNYARFLGLSEDEVMNRYGEFKKPQPAPPSPAAPGTQKTERPRPAPVETTVAETEPARRSGMKLEPYLWAGVIVIALASFLLTSLPKRRPVQERAGQATQAVVDSAAIHTGQTTTGKPEKLYLEIDALEDVWVLVRTDVSPQKKAVLKKGEHVTWSADDRFLLSYAGVGAAKLVLNGKELTVNGPRNAVVRDLIITAQGIAYQKVESEQPRPRKPRPVSQATPTAQTQSLQPSVTQAPAPAPSAPPTERPPASPVEPTFLRGD